MRRRKFCQHCNEQIKPGEDTAFFNNGTVAMHRACALRGVVGSVAHLERRCSCFVPGSEENDPPDMTTRQAAEAAAILYGKNQGEAV